MQSLLLVIILCLNVVYGWGSDGHRLVGYIAEAFLKDHSEKIVQNELGTETLADVGPWADQIRADPGYRWVNPLHYVDVQDHPGNSCGYVDERDCPNGHCLIGAISNFTKQLMCNKKQVGDAQENEEEEIQDIEDLNQVYNWRRRNNGNQSSYQSIHVSPRSLALRFVDHFMGDLTQPLHVCGRDRGGNTDHVLFGNQHTLNFHKLWDTTFIKKRIKDDFEDWKDYGNYLIKQIKTGTYKRKVGQWLSKYSLNETNPATGNLKAVIEWAQDTNILDCSIVWPGFDKDPLQDFSLDYYEQVFSTVDLQLAKGGYRLAHVLNQVLSNC